MLDNLFFLVLSLAEQVLAQSHFSWLWDVLSLSSLYPKLCLS